MSSQYQRSIFYNWRCSIQILRQKSRKPRLLFLRAEIPVYLLLFQFASLTPPCPRATPAVRCGDCRVFGHRTQKANTWEETGHKNQKSRKWAVSLAPLVNWIKGFTSNAWPHTRGFWSDLHCYFRVDTAGKDLPHQNCWSILSVWSPQLCGMSLLLKWLNEIDINAHVHTLTYKLNSHSTSRSSSHKHKGCKAGGYGEEECRAAAPGTSAVVLLPSPHSGCQATPATRDGPFSQQQLQSLPLIGKYLFENKSRHS